jgi:hypothetical protein
MREGRPDKILQLFVISGPVRLPCMIGQKHADGIELQPRGIAEIAIHFRVVVMSPFVIAVPGADGVVIEAAQVRIIGRKFNAPGPGLCRTERKTKRQAECERNGWWHF